MFAVDMSLYLFECIYRVISLSGIARSGFCAFLVLIDMSDCISLHYFQLCLNVPFPILHFNIYKIPTSCF